MTEQNVVAILQLLLTASGLAGVAVTWFKTAKTRGAYEQKISSDIDALKESIGKLEHTIGNGGIRGLKSDIQDIKLACAARMARLETTVNMERGEG
jgi:hypothetical protein